MIEHLEVRLWGRAVGTLAAYLDRYKHKALFYFDHDYLRDGHDISPLRAPLNTPALQRGAPVYPEEDKLFCGLPSFIADSLPDTWGERVFNEWARKNGMAKKHITILDRLAYTGRRGMGALEYFPPTAEDLEQPTKVEIKQLHDHSARIYAALEDADQSININDLRTDALYRVGMSAGGKHPKALININAQGNQCHSGQVPPPDDSFIPSIIKFDELDNIPFTKLEYSYYLMAQDMGLNMMPSRLMAQDGACHFVTQRFDRKQHTKLHTQTLAAMYPSAQSYEALFHVINRLHLPHAERQQAFIAMVANVVTANVDDHSKNFSFIMAPDGAWHLAPAYDYTFSLDPQGSPWDNDHSLTINGKASGITNEDLLQIARENSIKHAQRIIDNVINAAKHFDTYAHEAALSPQWTSIVKCALNDRLTLMN